MSKLLCAVNQWFYLCCVSSGWSLQLIVDLWMDFCREKETAFSLVDLRIYHVPPLAIVMTNSKLYKWFAWFTFDFNEKLVSLRATPNILFCAASISRDVVCPFELLLVFLTASISFKSIDLTVNCTDVLEESLTRMIWSSTIQPNSTSTVSSEICMKSHMNLQKYFSGFGK